MPRSGLAYTVLYNRELKVTLILVLECHHAAEVSIHQVVIIKGVRVNLQSTHTHIYTID